MAASGLPIDSQASLSHQVPAHLRHLVESQAKLLTVEIADGAGAAAWTRSRRIRVLALAREAAAETEDALPDEVLEELAANSPSNPRRRRRASSTAASPVADQSASRLGRWKHALALPPLQGRDLRFIDPAFGHARAPAVLIRKGCLVLTAPPGVRAVIFPSVLLFFPSPGVDDELRMLTERLLLKPATPAGEPAGGARAPVPGGASQVLPPSPPVTPLKSRRRLDPLSSPLLASTGLPMGAEVKMPFVLKALEGLLVVVSSTTRARLMRVRPRVKRLAETVSRLLQRGSDVCSPVKNLWQVLSAACACCCRSRCARPQCSCRRCRSCRCACACGAGDDDDGGDRGTAPATSKALGPLPAAAEAPLPPLQGVPAILEEVRSTRRFLTELLQRASAAGEALEDILDNEDDLSSLAMLSAISLQHGEEAAMGAAAEGTAGGLPANAAATAAADGGGSGEGDAAATPEALAVDVGEAAAEEESPAETGSRMFLHRAGQLAPVAELMLESYMAELMEVVGAATRLQSELDVLDSQFSLMLASTRNRLLRLDLAVSLVALTLAAGGTIGGIFGMNVPNGLENDKDAFRVISFAVGGFTAAVCLLVGGWVLGLSVSE